MSSELKHEEEQPETEHFQSEGGAPAAKYTTKKINKKQNAPDMTTETTLYTKTMLEIKIVLLPTEIGENKTKQNIKHIIASQIEGKCIREGYVKPNSVNIHSYSCGLVKGEYIEFTVVFECKTCYPTEGTWLTGCKCRSITKAGIHADIYDENGNIPATIFVARDHFTENRYFNTIQEKDMINVKVIGVRFEMNDECVEVLGNLMQPSSSGSGQKN
jgi:DNA-directed RNA polymerase subunit E'/Rpb7